MGVGPSFSSASYISGLPLPTSAVIRFLHHHMKRRSLIIIIIIIIIFFSFCFFHSLGFY